MEELPDYDQVRRNRTERQVPCLAEDADVVVDTDRCRAEDVLVRAAAHLGLYGRSYERLVRGPAAAGKDACVPGRGAGAPG